MNKTTLYAWVLAVVCLTSGLPIRAAQDLTDAEKSALRRFRNGGPDPDVGDMRTDEEKEEASWRVGLEVLGSSPRQDFRDLDSRTGYGGALFVENDLGGGWRVQSRFDFLRFPQTTGGVINGLIPGQGTFQPLTLAADSSSLGAEAQYHLPYPGLTTFYLTAGLRAIRYEFTYTTVSNVQSPSSNLPTGTILNNKYRTSMKMGATLGLGLDLSRRLSLTFRYTYLDLSGTAFVTYETGLGVRF
jgi:opacity protein-like surface antigen